MFSEEELELLSHILNSTVIEDLLENSVDKRLLDSILEKVEEQMNGSV